MSEETLAEPDDPGKHGKAERPADLPHGELDAATVWLLDRFAIRINPIRAAARRAAGLAGYFISRRSTAQGLTEAAAWYAGPIGPQALRDAAAATDPVDRLIREMPGGTDAVYRLAAAARGLAFRRGFADVEPGLPRPPPARVAGSIRSFLFRNADESAVLAVAPTTRDLLDRLDQLGEEGRVGVVITTPLRLSRALQSRIATRTMAEAISRLARLDPLLSARGSPTLAHRVTLATAVLSLPAAIWFAPSATFGLMHVTSAISFSMLGYLRAIAMAAPRAPPPVLIAEMEQLPVYSVLVALYDEAHMVPGLLAALERLDYPRERLDVWLLLEADDLSTIAAVERGLRTRPNFSFAVCPPGQPRTKPRALAYGLAFARGELVTVFDAEDRPHPLQLKVAAAAFAAAPAHRACLQAQLGIDRVRNGLQRQFAIEYAVLFDGLLPWLGARNLPIPLGGTSNHFRRDALEIALGWDPWNVTEDADLGIRLMRYGFSVDTIDSVTAEEAPDTTAVWLRQRRRWIKGWMVTWAVHMRRPHLLMREIGWRNAAMVQVHMLANVGAPLCHPLGLLLIVLHVAGVLPLPLGRSFLGDCLFAASVLGLGFGYGASLIFARRLLVRRGRGDLASSVWWMPLYWLLGSFAAWQALCELIVNPHRWAKTPHAAHDVETNQ